MLANRGLDLIGNTPVVRVDGLDAGPCERDGDRFLGLVTQIDLLNHLRRRVR